VCGYLSGSQDNWLITQFINNTARRDIYISVKFSINAQCRSGCSTVLDMLVLQTGNANQSFVRNVTNFPTPAIAALTDTVRDGTTLTTFVEMIAPESAPGVYVAFRDMGTCIGVTEVVVYYPICDASSPMVGATFTDVGRPGDTVNGTCFSNMAVSLPGGSFEARCVLERRKSFWNVECMCLPGYSFISRVGTNQCRGEFVSVWCACLGIIILFCTMLD